MWSSASGLGNVRNSRTGARPCPSCRGEAYPRPLPADEKSEHEVRPCTKTHESRTVPRRTDAQKKKAATRGGVTAVVLLEDNRCPYGSTSSMLASVDESSAARSSVTPV